MTEKNIRIVIGSWGFNNIDFFLCLSSALITISHKIFRLIYVKHFYKIPWKLSHNSQGMVDTKGFEKIDAAAQITRRKVEFGSWTAATEAWSNTQGVIFEETYNVDFYNILTKLSPPSQRDLNHSMRDAWILSRGIISE